MELIIEETGTYRNDEEKVTQEAALFKAGRYEIEKCIYNYDDGSSCTDYRVSHDWAEKYLPDIYYEKRFGAKTGHFEIQTTSYGSLPSEEIDKVIAGYKEAQEAAALAEELAKEHIDKAEGRW